MKIKVKILTGFVLALILIIASGYLSYQSAENTINDNLVRRDINNFINKIIQLSSDYYETEASESYYILTNEDKYLSEMEIYNSKTQEGLIDLNKGENSVLKFDDIKKMFEKLGNSIDKEIIENLECIDVYKQKDLVASKNKYFKGLNYEQRTEISNVSHELIGRLEQLRSEVNDKAGEEASFTRLAIPAGSFLAILILITAFIILNRDILGREKAENQLKKLNENLEGIVTEKTKYLDVLNNELRKEIDERKRDEILIKESESRLRRFYESGMLGVIYWNMDGQITDANDKFLEIIGYTRDELLKGIIKWTELTPPEFNVIDSASTYELKNTGINRKPFEKEYIKKDGTRVPIIIAAAMMDEERFNGVAFVLDNSVRKEAEIALIETDKELRAALSEKEVLLKEIHHRVKNNLQIVTSLLNMQSDLVKDQTIKEYFKLSADRVRSMALIHQQLYRSFNLSKINFEYYLKDLVFHLYKLYCTNTDKIKININTRGVTLDIDNAVPCGLMINEIVTNAFKHAFPGDRNGVINIDMKMKDGEYILKIGDNGVGLPLIEEAEEKKGLGKDLIKMLSEQLDAKMEINRGIGTEYVFTFKTLTYKKRV